MKLPVYMMAGLAIFGLSLAKETRIEDVKVISKDGKYEEVKKQVFENGKLIRTEIITIKRAMNHEKKNELSDTCTDFEETKPSFNRRGEILNQFLKHFRMAKMLHSLLNHFPHESALEEPEVKPPPHHRRIVIIRLPLTSMPFPFSSSSFPSLKPINETKPGVCKIEKTICPDLPEDNDVPPPSSPTTPSPPTDQIEPPPEVINNSIE